MSSSASTSPSPQNIRICLIGSELCNDASIIEAAQTFGVPIVTSQTGVEFVNDLEWRTFFVLHEFNSAIYDAIHKHKQCILGPPALRHSAAMKDGLICNARPLYNNAMRGVVTCFTGIRKKDELTRLVNLIHSMGGCIRKDMNSKITHLISTHSGGDKYQYAKTFRLTVVRPAWVYAAWEQRDVHEFRATTEEFSKEHRLQAFEGQKICFFGFPAEEHQHMVDVLRSNGGQPAELDDPECSHVVMPNSGGFFPETLANTSPDSPPLSTDIETLTNPNHSHFAITNAPPMNPQIESTDMEVDIETDADAATEHIAANNKENNAIAYEVIDEGDESDHFDARLVVDGSASPREDSSPIADYLKLEEQATEVLSTNASTPKSAEPKTLLVSPICSTPTVTRSQTMALQMQAQSMKMEDEAEELIANEDDEYGGATLDELNELKRKRESFDSVSLLSIDSFAMPASTKKPKLIRAGSITRSIKRSMSFVAVRTPIAKMLRPRRSSVALDSAPNNETTMHDNDYANDSICSIASVESAFNESIRKPVKEKLRSLRERITRSTSSGSSKKDKYVVNAAPPRTPEKQNKTGTLDDGFKTPKAPGKFPSVNSRAGNNTPKGNAFGCGSSGGMGGGPQQQSSQRQSQLQPQFSPQTATINNSCVCVTSTAVSSVPQHTNVCNQVMKSNVNNNKLNTNNTHNNSYNYSSNNINNNNISVNDDAVMQCENEDANSQQLTKQFTRADGPMVVDEHTTQTKPEARSNRTHILKSDWFWYTIQNGYADEVDYLFGDYLDSIANTPNTDRRDSLPISFNKRKRKRFSQRLQLEGTPLGSGKRRSSVSDAGLLSVSGSFFDCTTSPDKLEGVSVGVTKLLNEPETSVCEPTPAKKSMRFNHFMDFYSTESNYVGILDTIVNLFKNPLEDIAECSDALLNKSEIRAIFGNFLPIHEVHQSMLERLRSIHSKWTEDCLIGDIILQHRDELIKAYPPYVNFFEQMKEALQQSDKENPRFHAFLKINQTKPECGRQSLQDLMIRPVQRLPSVCLLLNDILKHTNKNNQDYARLEEALKAIKEVMMHINEDKRKTESRMAIFDIFNDIEGCPPHLVSSNRSFISKCEVTEHSDNLSGRGDTLMLYLFSDTIEVCKKRSRGFNSAKSPSSTKAHKHVKLVSLNAIRYVIDITDSPRAFALLSRQEKDKLHCFTITDEEIDKIVYLKTLCKQMAENACRTDTDKALLCRTSQELEVDISDVNLSTLSKAFKLAARTRLKVGRAFSFNKTPSKLKRAVSTMMTSPFGSTNSLTPASQLAQMRLASCTNIHEVADEDGSRSSSPSIQSEVLMPPLSVQPARKNKTSTLTSMVGRI